MNFILIVLLVLVILFFIYEEVHYGAKIKNDREPIKREPIDE